jgi:hypothetical protein
VKNKKYPDQVVWSPETGFNAGLLPYSTNIGAPAINPENMVAWKAQGIKHANSHLHAECQELFRQWQALLRSVELNQLVYSAKFNFVPIPGETYHLYLSRSGGHFLSIIRPNEWQQTHIGSFRLGSDHRWSQV